MEARITGNLMDKLEAKESLSKELDETKEKTNRLTTQNRRYEK